MCGGKDLGKESNFLIPQPQTSDVCALVPAGHCMPGVGSGCPRASPAIYKARCPGGITHFRSLLTDGHFPFVSVTPIRKLLFIARQIKAGFCLHGAKQSSQSPRFLCLSRLLFLCIPSLSHHALSHPAKHSCRPTEPVLNALMPKKLQSSLKYFNTPHVARNPQSNLI